MNLVDRIVLVSILVTLGAQIIYRRSFWFFSYPLKKSDGFVSFSKFLKIIWTLSVLIIFGILFYWSYLQYSFWQGSEMTRYLLPPYQSISYFISYVGVRFFGPWFLALLASFLISGAVRFLNKKFEERFFEDEEIRLIALGIFLTGYPGFIFYLVSILVVGVLLSTFYFLLSKGRMPFYYFWMPMAIFAMIMKIWLLSIFHLTSFWSQFALGDFYKLIFGF